jgi:hypothetical protein
MSLGHSHHAGKGERHNRSGHKLASPGQLQPEFAKTHIVLPFRPASPLMSIRLNAAAGIEGATAAMPGSQTHSIKRDRQFSPGFEQ